MNDDNLLLAVAAIAAVVALANMVIVFQDASGISGYATDNTSEGVASITLKSNVAIEFTDSVVSWGGGHHNAGVVKAELDSEGTVINGTWENVTSCLKLENLGNVNASINLSTGKNATGFIGGSLAGGPVYEWKMENIEEGTCNSLVDTSYTSVSTKGREICSSMGHVSGKDMLGVDIKVIVPQDTPKEPKEDTITAIATAI